MNGDDAGRNKVYLPRISIKCRPRYCKSTPAATAVTMLSPALYLDALLLALCVTPATATAATHHPKHTEQQWQSYVRAPSSTTVSPASIVSNYTQGNVANPEGLLTAGGDPTVLTRPQPAAGAADVTPEIVIDFGQNIVGYLSINFAGASNSTSGLPGIRVAFSESIQYGYLTNVSDFSRSYNVSSPVPAPLRP
jgi:hypothetical protein